MRKKDRYARTLALLAEAMPLVKTELSYENTFQLLVAVVLSAQCTDRRVNLTTPRLFERFPTAREMAEAEPEEVFELIRSVSYPNAKARHLVALSRRLMEVYGGEVPSERDELTTLPGVGRKTANVVMSVAFEKDTIAVDTHVFRVAHRLGLVPKSATTPLAVERELLKHIPTEHLHDAHHRLLLHGRYVCQARKPRCATCPLAALCPTHGGQPSKAEP